MFYDPTLSAEVRALAARLDEPPVNEALRDGQFVGAHGDLTIAVDVRIMAALLNRIERLEERVEKLDGRTA